MMTVTMGQSQANKLEFWIEQDKIKSDLIARHQDHVKLFRDTKDNDAFEGQPGDGSGLFIMSVKNRIRHTMGGGVTCVNFHVAATRIADETHRLATHAEIREFLSSREETYRVYQAEEDRKAGKNPTVNVTIDGNKQKTEQSVTH